MARREKLRQDSIEEFEFTRNSVQGSVVESSGIDRALDGFETERVVANLR